MSKLASLKILVVDDMKIQRKLISKFLIKFGATAENIFEGENGQEGQDLVKQNQFDLVISDWNMPIMTGLELLKFCKQNESQIICSM